MNKLIVVLCFLVIFTNSACTQKEDESVQKYKEAAEQGDLKAQFSLGDIYLKGKKAKKDYDQAIY